jgi:hypothetical protein
VLTPNRHTIGRKNPQGWTDYWYVISGKRIPFYGYVDPSKYDAIDRGNRVGNHLGSLDAALEIRLKKVNFVIYRSFFFDDGSLFYKANVSDGLNGLSVKIKNSSSQLRLTGITAEFLSTVSQGGDQFTLDGGPRGRDNYFNHIQYEGWVYKDNIIGTPFITSKEQTRKELSKPSVFYISNNNRVKLFHLGLSAANEKTTFIMKLSYSENLGTYDYPFPKPLKQFSASLDIRKTILLGKIRGLQGKLTIATDLGDLYYNSTGVHIGLVKNGIL